MRYEREVRRVIVREELRRDWRGEDAIAVEYGEYVTYTIYDGGDKVVHRVEVRPDGRIYFSGRHGDGADVDEVETVAKVMLMATEDAR